MATSAPALSSTSLAMLLSQLLAGGPTPGTGGSPFDLGRSTQFVGPEAPQAGTTPSAPAPSVSGSSPAAMATLGNAATITGLLSGLVGLPSFANPMTALNLTVRGLDAFFPQPLSLNASNPGNLGMTLGDLGLNQGEAAQAVANSNPFGVDPTTPFGLANITPTDLTNMTLAEALGLVAPTPAEVAFGTPGPFGGKSGMFSLSPPDAFSLGKMGPAPAPRGLSDFGGNPDSGLSEAAAAMAAAVPAVGVVGSDTGTTSAPGSDTGGVGGVWHQGGPIPNRGTRRLSDVMIRAKEGEFVVRPQPAKRYRKLLDAINADRPREVKRLATRMLEPHAQEASR